MHELRCDAKLHGIIIGDEVIEVQCRSRFCGYKPGIVVLHRFSTVDGELVETLRFKDSGRKVRESVSDNDPVAVRSA